MILIALQLDDGISSRRCDANCYNAKHPECKCVCGGLNHGKGYNWAVIDQTERILPELRLKYPGKSVYSPVINERNRAFQYDTPRWGFPD